MIIHYSQGPFSYNPEVWSDFSEENRIRIGLDAKLKCSPDQDEFGVQMDIMVNCGDRSLLNIGLLFAFHADGFGKAISEDPKLIEHHSELTTICAEAWYATIGVVAAKTAIPEGKYPEIAPTAPVRSGFILPSISPEAISNDIKIIISQDE